MNIYCEYLLEGRRQEIILKKKETGSSSCVVRHEAELDPNK